MAGTGISLIAFEGIKSRDGNAHVLFGSKFASLETWTAFEFSHDCSTCYRRIATLRIGSIS